MIRSFCCRDNEALFLDHVVSRFRSIERVARRKLLYFHAAAALKGDRIAQYSIPVNDQWRICFAWRAGEAHGVEIVDYH